MFESIYESPWIATALLALVNLVGLAVWLRRATFLVRYLVLFALVAFADALRSGSWSPLHLLASPVEEQLGVAFVLAGDLRYFLLTERFACAPAIGPHDRTPARAWLGAVALTLLVPSIAFAGMRLLPSVLAGRKLYLAWELACLALALGHRFVLLPKRLAATPASVRAWLLDVNVFVLAYYGLWSLSNALLLGGVEAAYVLRIVPNVLYYGVFLWFVALRAPAEVER